MNPTIEFVEPLEPLIPLLIPIDLRVGRFLLALNKLVKSGILQGVEGTLVRRSGGDRFVLSFETINQHAAIQVSAEDLEPVRS